MTEFAGFKSSRHQQHDAVITEVVLDFNQNKAARCGCTAEQAATIPDLSADLVKSWAIQESGGSDARSLAAWKGDPVQVNVPGDWNDYKSDVGLKEPKVRNEGDMKTNLTAGVSYLCRKGFGKSGRAPKADATFDGWETALRRYNGRTDEAADGKTYSENYAAKIKARAESPNTSHEIQIAKKKPK